MLFFLSNPFTYRAISPIILDMDRENKMQAAIRTTKERGFFRAVAIDNHHEYSDADVAVCAKTRSMAVHFARKALKEKGYKVVSQWEIY